MRHDTVDRSIECRNCEKVSVRQKGNQTWKIILNSGMKTSRIMRSSRIRRMVDLDREIRRIRRMVELGQEVSRLHRETVDLEKEF